ncbi:A disintegrin and metalloproteinase with thrombospondin motifs 12-like [Homalodisca vitripennis]|uniref:A disintegrin and metalloproteinase with thrombospondin motifs 12-like n=1 Tax=Homalodisca vitripennis TaxID=197043 RepID=UPI001EEC0164|nr:A disintegrin and metalloproteinase with thrombospondin motifs 12-like [Homalodisca vitripennis]
MYVTNKSLLQFLCIVVLINLSSPDHKNLKAKSTEDKPKVIHGRYTRDITDFHIVVPQKVHPNGSFHSHHLPHYFHPSVRKKRNLEDERIHYLLHFGGLSHVLELEPNAHITSPGMLVETRATGSDISGATFRRPRRHLCHFHGSVRGSPGSRVAISSCDGLVGMIRTASGTFFVEPLHGESPEEGKEHIHVVYKRSLQPTGRSCNVRGDDWWSIWTTRLRQYMDSHPVRKRSEAGVTVQRWYELMIATDKKFLTFHKDIDVEEYVICIMNMVADYYHDKSVGNLIDIVIVRIIYLEKQEEEIDLETSNSGESTLDSFCIWQAKMNPKDYFHPNHHDLGVLLTRYDICSADEDGCNLLGLAHMGTACSNDLNCCINEDSGLILGITATHEIGHTLSCTHDAPEESGCEPVTAAGDSTIMNPRCLHHRQTAEMQATIHVREQIKVARSYLDYIGDAQTKVPFEPGQKSTCSMSLVRFTDGERWRQNNVIWHSPAEGTKCGTDKWCFNKTCVMIGARPQAVNGEWGEWGKWSPCSRTCGGGVEVRERLCDNPQPSNKGRYCSGKRSEYNMCNTQECTDNSGPTFRELQCTEFDKKPFEGVLHTWKPYKAPDSDPNPCALYCLSNDGVYTKLAPRVKDGTRCKPGTRDTCIQGACMPVGCDWKIASEAVEDVCGICDGDGTHCTVVEDVFKGVPTTGYAPIATVPKGAMNVKLAESTS